jgi:Protein of unknown function (DUF5672)
MLLLPNVTLVSIFTVCHELTFMAVDDCLKCAEFGDVKLFTDKPGPNTIKIDKFATHNEFARFANYTVPQHLQTSHILTVQWDSWVLNPNAWNDEFLAYDYIGAPWWYNDDYNVGNSGFCLRSKRLMDYLTEHESDFPIGSPEDHVLCREYQKRLPQFKWAPARLAWKFAVERTAIYPVTEVFGFHGLFNWPLVMKREALQERIELASRDPYITSKPEWQEVMRLLKQPTIFHGERVA